jgi:nicotinamidase-related amidase
MDEPITDPRSIAVIVVDLQEAMFDGKALPPVHDAAGLERRALALLSWARCSDIKVAFIQHDGEPGHLLAPGAPGWPLRASLNRQDNEPIFSKSDGNAFDNGKLLEWIKALDVSKIILLGVQTDQCVALTHAGALEHGLSIVVVADGHSTWDSDGKTAESLIRAYNQDFSHAESAVVSVATLIGHYTHTRSGSKD